MHACGGVPNPHPPAVPDSNKAKRSDFRGIAILCGRDQLVCASREAGGLCKSELGANQSERVEERVEELV